MFVFKTANLTNVLFALTVTLFLSVFDMPLLSPLCDSEKRIPGL